MEFLLGTPTPGWLERVDVPLFVSWRRLRKRKRMPVALGRWALDSGGFTEVSTHGRWVTSTNEYVEGVARYAEGVGQLAWAAPMDWMCEPFITALTGLSVREHQHRTVANYLELRDTGLPFIPVLQGWKIADYLRCIEAYEDAGVDLHALPLVGLGSVCRRQGTGEIEAIVSELAQTGLRLHGFGIKTRGLARYAECLASGDSMAWSYNARKNPPLPQCVGQHLSCNSCIVWAMAWRERLIASLAGDRQLRLVANSRWD